MDWKQKIRDGFTAATRVPDDDVLEELAHHAKAEYDTARAEGCTAVEADARVDALLARWTSEAAILRHRSRRPPVVEPPPATSSGALSGVGGDISYAFRLLRRQPRYAAVSILTMALAIGATTLLFSVTYGVLMKPLPWPSADRLVVLKETRGGNPPRFGAFTNAAYLAWRDQTNTVDAFAAWTTRTVTMTGRGDPSRVRITVASASLFDVLEVRPVIGSFFQQKDEAAAVVVLSESLWRQRFGADPSVLGTAVRFDGQAHTVVAVMPEEASYPDSQTLAWLPMTVRPATGNWLSVFNLLGKLKPGATPLQAAEEGTARGKFAADTGMTTMAIFGNKGEIGVTAQPLRQALTADVRRPLIVLLVAVALLLVTATGNVASLQLARATTRQREMSIRTALGAGMARVTRQLLVESLLISLIGGATGVALAAFLYRFVPTVLPADFPRMDALGINGVVLLFASAIAIGTGITCGLFPTLRLRRLNLVSTLTEDAGAPVGGGSRSMLTRVRTVIMAGQVAIACVLLIGGALLGRSFLSLLDRDRGIDPTGVLTARVTLPAASYTPEQRHVVSSRILERLAQMPGITHAAFTSEFPLIPGGSTAALSVRPRTANAAPVPVQASPRIVSPAYFKTLGIRIAAGRGFAESDTEGAPPVVVVNRTFARRFLGDDALGGRLPMGVGYRQSDREATIVGVIEDVRYLSADDPTHPEIYHSSRQFDGKLPVSTLTLMVRASGRAAELARPVRTAVREADSGLVAEGIATMEERMLRGLARPRLYAIVLGGFAAAALMVAAVGLFGVLSYTVAQRSRELAVRTALGATRGDVVRLVMRQMLGVTATGIVAGMFAALMLTRSLATLLYGVTPHDLTTFVAVPVVLIAVAAAASLPPAIRAARLDPLRALRG